MTVNNFIKLTNSNSSLIKQFRVVATGYQPMKEKLTTQRITVTGKLDHQVGPTKRRWNYVIRVYETDPTDPTKSDGDTSGYGRIDHLMTFFDYDNPSGTPTNVITFQDFDDSENPKPEVYIVNAWAPRTLTPMLTGTNAIFEVMVQMVEAD